MLQGDVCYSGFSPCNETNVYHIGDFFIDHYLPKFDSGNKRMGFAISTENLWGSLARNLGMDSGTTLKLSLWTQAWCGYILFLSYVLLKFITICGPIEDCVIEAIHECH